LKCALPVLAHKNLDNAHFLHQIFNKFSSIFKHNDDFTSRLAANQMYAVTKVCSYLKIV